MVRDALSGSVKTSVPFTLGSIYPDARAMRQSRFQDFRYYARELSREEAPRVAREDYVAALATRAPDSWNEDEARAVADFYFASRD